MSAFIDLDKFRKSGLLTKGDPGSASNLTGFQDPTYLSFTLIFDVGDNSPLLNGEAEGFIRKHLTENNNGGLNIQKYQHKLSSLLAFRESLFKINSQMPWHWQTLGGVDRLLKFTPENAYFGGDDAKLIIGCLETINMNIAGLMQLYRKAVWDETRWSYVLPPNLRKFGMYIYVSDIRGIYDNAATSVIAGESNRPFFMFDLRYCEFNLAESGNKLFGDLSASAPEVASNEITINYQRVYNVDARALNGAVFQNTDIQKGNPVAYRNLIAPTTDKETELSQNPRNLDDPEAKLDPETKRKIDEMGNHTDPAAEKKLPLKQNISKGFKNLKNKAKDQANGYGQRATADLKRMAKSKMEEAQIEAKRYVNRRIPNLENIYGKAMRALDAATDVRNIARSIESVVGKNVHFLDGTPLVDVLNKANRDALINIGNVYKR
jgi:hypothetical protein